jgi:hypothetical protein
MNMHTNHEVQGKVGCMDKVDREVEEDMVVVDMVEEDKIVVDKDAVEGMAVVDRVVDLDKVEDKVVEGDMAVGLDREVDSRKDWDRDCGSSLVFSNATFYVIIIEFPLMLDDGTYVFRSQKTM